MAQLEKLAVIGAGSVGSALAYASTIDRLADHIALYDINGALAEAQALDLSHGLQFVGGRSVTGGDDLALCAAAELVVVTAGATHGPGRTRLDLASANVRMVRELMPALLGVAPEAIYLFVTNPVDVVTFVAQEISGLPRERVIGTGTVLDSARLRHLLATRLGVAIPSVHAMVVGEHGDSEVVLWSSASVGGTPLLEVIGPDGDLVQAGELDGIGGQVRDTAAQIIAGKGSTNLAIGLATARIARAISRDEHAVLPVSVRVDIGGVGEVCMSVPSVIGRRGVLSRLPMTMHAGEQAALARSAAVLRAVIDDVI